MRQMRPSARKNVCRAGGGRASERCSYYGGAFGANAPTKPCGDVVGANRRGAPLRTRKCSRRICVKCAPSEEKRLPRGWGRASERCSYYGVAFGANAPTKPCGDVVGANRRDAPLRTRKCSRRICVKCAPSEEKRLPRGWGRASERCSYYGGAFGASTPTTG